MFVDKLYNSDEEKNEYSSDSATVSHDFEWQDKFN